MSPRRVIIGLAALLGAGCSPCEVTPPPIAACVIPADGGSMPDGDPLILEVTGDVSVAGRGAPEGTCLGVDPELGLTPSDFELPDARWLRINDADAGQSWIVGVYAEAIALWPERGDVVELRYGVNGRGDQVPAVTLELRNRSGGLLMFLGQAEEVDGLGLPHEVDLTLGERACGVKDGCGRAGQYALGFEVEGEALSLAPGELGQLGDYTLIHGGAERDVVGEQEACAEGGSVVRVGVVR